MANTIILKRSATPSKVPTTAQLALGEVAINTFDGRMFIKKDDGTPSVVEIGGVTSVNGQTGDAVLSTTDVSEGSNQYFTTARARAALSAGTGISYNSSTGVISTAQNLSTAGSPTFAGLTLTGNIGITGSIIPSADITYDLGSADKQWRDVYVGPGSLYVNGQKVLQDDSGTIAFTADPDQNIRIKTLGNGILQLGSSTTTLQVDSTLQITSGKNITDSSGIQVNFGDNIQMNSNKVVGLGAPSASTDAATKGYVDTQISAINTSVISQGNSSVAVVDTGTGTVNVTVDGSTALSVTSSGVVVAGNFTVQGTTTTVESNTVAVADNILTLNSDTTGTPTQNAGIEVERGDETNVQIRWNEAQTKWTFTNDGAVYYGIATGTDTLAEGSTNLYFTQARARTSLSASTATGVSYNSSTGNISLGSIPNSSLSNNTVSFNGISVALGSNAVMDTDSVGEGSTNVYFTNARARGAVSAGTGLAYNSSTGVFSTSAIPNASLSNSSITINGTSVALGGTRTLVTDDIAEDASPSNLWFTDARARAAVSASGDLSYNSSTGVFSFTKPSPVVTVTMTGDVTGSASATLTSLASGTVSIATTIAANSVALGTDTTGNYVAGVSAGTGISVSGSGSEGATVTVTNTGVTGLNSSTGSLTLANFHSSVQTVTSTQATNNASAGTNFTFSELSGAVHYNVLLNRMILRPDEFSVSGTTVTIAAGVLATDDELEVTGCKLS